MSRQWNGKAFIDRVAKRLWDTSTDFRAVLIEFANEVQDDLATLLPQNRFKIKLKKLLPTDQENICLEIGAPAASSAAISQTVTTLDYNTTTSGNYTFDSDQIEFGATSATMKNAGPSGETFYANFTTDQNAWRSSGSATGTNSGTVSVTGGKLDVSSSVLGFVSYNAASNMSSQQVGCVRFKYTPSYSGTPASDNWFFQIKKQSGSLINLVGLKHATSTGNMTPFVYNSAGAGVVTAAMGTWSPTSGTEYEIEFNWDLTTGATRLFIDGIQNGSTDTGTGTRDSNIGLALIGTGALETEISRGKYDDLQYFSTVQHTANFASEVPRVVGDYYATESKITLTSAQTVGELSAFSASTTEPASTAVKFIMNVDGQDKYWDGAAWSNSDGTFSQSSTAALINTNAAALLAGNASIKVVAVLNNTSDGNRPEITSVSITDVGQLTTQATYKVYTTFLIYDEDQKNYIESVLSAASGEATADLTDQSLSVTGIPTYTGDASVEPTTIHRRVYVAKKASGETEFGEPFFSQDIEDNTTTTLTISADPTSTITPPSDTELDDISSDHMYFEANNRILEQLSSNKLRRYDPDNSTSTSPDAFSFSGDNSINLYPKLSATATDAQRTLSYYVYRRPHEVFYDVDRPIDLPISMRKALIQGVVAKGYAYKDRHTAVTEENKYLEYKKEALIKLRRQKGAPSSIRDVNGDTDGYEV